MQSRGIRGRREIAHTDMEGLFQGKSRLRGSVKDLRKQFKKRAKERKKTELPENEKQARGEKLAMEGDEQKNETETEPRKLTDQGLDQMKREDVSRIGKSDVRFTERTADVANRFASLAVTDHEEEMANNK